MKKTTGQLYYEGRNEREIPYSEIVSRAHEAIILIDESQKIVLINQGAEQVFGYSASEVVGKALETLLPENKVEIHRAHVENFFRAPESARYMHQRREVMGQRKNGEIFPAEASIVKVGDSKKTIFAAILRDTSHRRETEARQATFARAIDQAGDIVFITNHEGAIEYVNPTFEELTGYEKKDALGQTPRILKSGAMPDEYYDWVWRTISAGEVVRAEVLDRKKSGELFYYDQTISPLKDSQGKITHFVSTGKDVTRRKRAEQEIQLLLDLIKSIAEADSFDAALEVTLQLVCETTDWDFGEVWIPSEDRGYLMLGAPFYSRIGDISAFRNISGQYEFKRGIGLVGDTWALGRSVWVADVTADPNFLRAEFAKQAGFKTALGIPVIEGKTIVTVLMFFMREMRLEDERMIRLADAISTQLGTAFQRKQAEEILKQSEARLRVAQHIAKLGNWDLDLSSNKLVWSNEIFRIFEVDKDKFEPSYQTFLDLIHPDDREMVDRAYTESVKSRQPYEIIHRLRMSDGRIKYVEEHGRSFYSAKGAPIRSLGTVQDITERVLSEKALRASEEKYRTIIHAAIDGYWLTDARGNILDVNERYCQMSGYSRAELLSMSISDVEAFEYPDAVAAHIKKLIAEGEDRFESLHRRKDGSIFDVEISAQYKPADGGSMVVFIRDITERKSVESQKETALRALRESEQRLSMIFETMSEGIALNEIILDERGEMVDYRILSVNPAFYSIADYRGGEAVGMLATELYGLSPEYIREFWKQHKDSKITTYTELKSPFKNRVFFVATSPFTDGKFVTSFFDVTERKEAEEALRISEERFKAIFNKSPLGIGLVNSETGRFEAVNPTYAKITGRSVKELLATDWMRITHPDDIHHNKKGIARLHDGQTDEFQMEKRYLRPDGSVVWINLKDVPLDMGGKKTPIHLAMTEDITERKQAEEALRASEEKFKTIFNEAPLGIALINSLTGRFESVNSMHAKIFGRSIEKMLSLDWMSITHPEDAQADQDNMRRMLSGKINGYQMEKRHIHPDGSVIWVNLTVTPLKIKDAPHPIHVAMVEDITERKQAEEALRVSEEKYRTVANFTYDWEAWRGPDGKYIYISPSCERITGHTAEEFLFDADLVMEIAHPHDMEAILEHRTEVSRQVAKLPLTFEFRIIRPDGEARWISHTCLPVYGEAGDFLGRRENNRDITEQKQAELELRDNQQRLREIVDAAPFGAQLYQLDENARLIFMDANESAGKILGVDNASFVGKTFEEAFPHLIRTDLPSAYRRAASQGIRYDAPRFSYNDGRLEAIFEIHAIQIAPGRMVSFFRNISELDAAYDETIVGWSRAMDLRDADTEKHTERVTNISVELARILGFNESELLYVRWGALLHDMGKIGVPDSILLKPGKLTEQERMLMHQHPQFAYEMLQPIRFLRPALDIPYSHHEKWDGTGYPRGLKGVEIPLAARIFALVDVWDALRSDRPYRQKWSRKKVTEHIRSLAGTHFDPALVDVFLDFVKNL